MKQDDNQLEFFDPGARRRRDEDPDDRTPWWVWVLAGLFVLTVGGGLLLVALHSCGVEVLP